MNILLALRQPLLPADTGGKVRSLNIFSRLAKRAHIHAVSFADPVLDASAIFEMRHIFDSYTPVPWRETRKYSARFYGEVLANHFGSWPYFLAKCNRPELRDMVEALLAKHDCDLLFCDFLHTGAPLGGVSFKPKVIFEHNVEFLLRKRKWEVEKNPLRKWIFDSEWRKTRAIEASVCRGCDHVLTVSEEDEAVFRDEFDVRAASTLPTGVDTDYFRPHRAATEAGRLVFVGSMDWDPNEDGVIWFLEEIYPRVRAEASNASLSVVGRNPSARLKTVAARTPGVELTGRVSDVRPYLAKAEVVVVPLRVGGGTRIKIPEAMAMGKAVVSTTIGAEGLPFKRDGEICIADEPHHFADNVISLIRDQGRRDAVGTAARRVVAAHHGWDNVVDKLESALTRVIDANASSIQPARIQQPSVYA